ncbi:MAG: type II toxin-antitoxin system PemK/MazF family toxin [Oscillospiraceae bacterium]|jgi:mRNA interferase MazF|nr:type II toxin-antitoxin system PemK/MazF family toxin [Oscillospiraceae bacterium]
MVKQGTIIKINFNPVVGSEQGGFRPAVVVSNNFVISKTNIISVCPITNKQGKTALNVLLDDRTQTQGAVLCAHSRSVDLGNRSYKRIEELPKDKISEILNTMIGILTPMDE